METRKWLIVNASLQVSRQVLSAQFIAKASFSMVYHRACAPLNDVQRNHLIPPHLVRVETSVKLTQLSAMCVVRCG